MDRLYLEIPEMYCVFYVGKIPSRSLYLSEFPVISLKIQKKPL
jgi:hypothetical protein